MHHTIETHSREEMIAFGNAVGKILLESGRDRHWFISLEGDQNSGKGLIALAIDLAFNPTRYPNGIETSSRVDMVLYPGDLDYPQVVFKNFATILPSGKTDFDNALTSFRDNNPRAYVLIASNLDRRLPDTYKLFDYSTGIDSDVLDINCNVRKLCFSDDTSFDRKIELAFKDGALLPRIIANFNSERLLPCTVSVPDRPAAGNPTGVGVAAPPGGPR